MVASIAYLLIAHGSRDSRSQAAVNRLAQLVRERLQKPLYQTHGALGDYRSDHHWAAVNADAIAHPYPSVLTTRGKVKPNHSSSGIQTQTLERTRTALQGSLAAARLAARVGRSSVQRVLVGTACLENSPLTLHEQICEFGRRAKAAGIKQLKLVPLFLMRGMHVMEDIPAEVAAARRILGGGLSIWLCPHLGSHEAMADLLFQKLTMLAADGYLLVAHGSRRPKGNRQIEALAKTIGADVAYWSTPPDLETQVVSLMQKGCQKLAILPYFLFAGGITDAIIHLTEELAERFPKTCFRLMPPLGATAEVADLVVDLIRQPQADCLAG